MDENLVTLETSKWEKDVWDGLIVFIYNKLSGKAADVAVSRNNWDGWKCWLASWRQNVDRTMVRFYPGTVNRSDRWDHDRLKMCSPKLAIVPVPYESSNVKAGLILSLELFVLNGCKESRKTGLACSIGPQCDCMALRVLTARNKTFHSWKLRQSRPDTQSWAVCAQWL